MPDLATLESYLTEAEAAKHNFLTGKQEVSVSLHGFGSTTYNENNIGKLDAYISDLKSQIAKKSGTPRRGPLRMRF